MAEQIANISQAQQDILQISTIVSTKINQALEFEFLKFGLIFGVMIILLVIVYWYFIKPKEYAKTDEGRLNVMLTQIKDTNKIIQKEYIASVNTLKYDLLRQAEEIKEAYMKDLETFKHELTQSMNINKDVLEAYKEFYKIKSLVYQDIDHKDLTPQMILPIVYLRLNKTYKRLYDFEKTYGYILPQDIAQSLITLIQDCKNGLDNDSIKDAKFSSSKTFISALEAVNNKFRKYLSLK